MLFVASVLFISVSFWCFISHNVGLHININVSYLVPEFALNAYILYRGPWDALSPVPENNAIATNLKVCGNWFIILSMRLNQWSACGMSCVVPICMCADRWLSWGILDPFGFKLMGKKASSIRWNLSIWNHASTVCSCVWILSPNNRCCLWNLLFLLAFKMMLLFVRPRGGISDAM